MNKQVLSGIQSTSIPHIGNYLGALKPWAKSLQNSDVKSFFMIADLHVISLKFDPSELFENRILTFASLVACGVDPEKCTLFLQSYNPDHTYLNWLLSSVSQTGELSRMIQYKEKGKGEDTSSLALYAYPVLQAADILLYDATHVPVGEDQKQHVELTRDIAQRFNHYFGENFILPEPENPPVGSKIKNLQNPEKKMSKSGNDTFAGVIFITDTNEEIEKKVKKAVTDTEGSVYFAEEKSGISNLLTIASGFLNKPVEQIEKECADMQYGTFKTYISDILVEGISPIREQIKVLLDDKAQLIKLINFGAEKAMDYSSTVIERTKKVMGLNNI